MKSGCQLGLREKKKIVSDPAGWKKKTHPGGREIIFLSKISISLFLKIALFICIL